MHEDALDNDDEFLKGNVNHEFLQRELFDVMYDVYNDGTGYGAGFGLQDGNGGYKFNCGMNIEFAGVPIDDFIPWEVEFTLS